MRYSYTNSGEYGRSAVVRNSFSVWKGYEYFDYYFDLEYPYNLSIQSMIINYAEYVTPVILHQICFIIILFKIRSRLWKRHIKPFRWS